jgi:hypothetical protein
MVQSILYGWIFGIEKGAREAHKGAHIRIPWLVQLMLKYVVPVYLLVIFTAFCYREVPEFAKSISEQPVALWSILFILTVLAFLLLLVHIAGQRWEAEGRFDHLDD